MPIILGIESSCDETSASICIDGEIVTNIIATQAIHEQFGGVVPEHASRLHLQNIVSVCQQALQKAAVHKEQLNAIACTKMPGLLGSLLVGCQFAKSMALALHIPVIGVNHMQAHVLANLIDKANAPEFPFLCLTVSGGHTQIVLAESPYKLSILGETIDDAAGEAFDKTAKLLGLPYPGGPLIDKYAALGNPKAFEFAKPNIPHLDFSFSGLKTSVLYFLQKQNPELVEQNLHDICASVQQTIIHILLKKLEKAIAQTQVKTICLAGGVSANTGLRKAFLELGIKKGYKTHIPNFEFCTDNAAMIALTGYFKFLNKDFENLDFSPSARAVWE